MKKKKKNNKKRVGQGVGSKKRILMNFVPSLQKDFVEGLEN